MGAEGGQEPIAAVLLFRWVVVIARALEPAPDGRRLRHLLRRHSGRPNRRASSRTSARRLGSGAGSWIIPSRFSRSVTAGISSQGWPYWPRKKWSESGRRGRCPPASRLSAG